MYDADPWIAPLMEFIRNAYQSGQKLIGICFGHQAIAHALGGHAEKSKKGWGFGLKTIEIAQNKPWMASQPDQCSLYFVHQEQVQRLPPGAELLGGNDFCPIGFYAIGDQVLSIQGHPEFTLGIMEDILVDFKKDIPAEKYEEFGRSLGGGVPDNRVVAEWMVRFLSVE